MGVGGWPPPPPQVNLCSSAYATKHQTQGFWGDDRQCAFFDVRVFDPFAHSYRNVPLTTGYRRNEQEKGRAYDQRVREIKLDCFTPLVFTSSGSMGSSATVMFKRLASLIASKNNKSYSQTMDWLSFSITLCHNVPLGILLHISAPKNQQRCH